jgi:hypothetical protein
MHGPQFGAGNAGSQMGFPIRGQDWSAARLESRIDLLCCEVFIRHNCRHYS